ncbi:MAG: hypothetical protein WCL43_01805 [Chlorobium sp.]
MKKHLFVGIIVSLGMVGLVGNVSLAEDNQSDNTNQTVKTEATPAIEKSDSKTEECCTVGELQSL